ncbi:hypothetical protein [Pelovirga terrestris]|uniref:Uncharacterized protein n=1 Tax=Pelovirga terrestris TaxID=2771352 RepID=A0A8J6QSL0_9BACT|nr:hypothetical protein [Pelovirga terrestris]MBD1400900.1 hypothetical protein [Pelovirga terrestris]
MLPYLGKLAGTEDASIGQQNPLATIRISRKFIQVTGINQLNKFGYAPLFLFKLLQRASDSVHHCHVRREWQGETLVALKYLPVMLELCACCSLFAWGHTILSLLHLGKVVNRTNLFLEQAGIVGFGDTQILRKDIGE